jgi:hypothetical protein
MLDYCIGIAKEFQSRINRMQTFVKKHNLSSGGANEAILREFLSMHAPTTYEVGQGFICHPTEPDSVSRQCDILIFDQSNFPVIHSDGPVKIVLPEAASMVVEVKTRFTKNEVMSSLLNVEAAKKSNSEMTGVIFAFGSPSLSSVLQNLQGYPHHIHTDDKPTAILLFDKGIIIHRWGLMRGRDIDRTPDGDAEAFGVRVAKRDKGAVVVTFLLLHFFEKVARGLLWSSVANMLLDLLEEHTEKADNDIYIGPSRPTADGVSRSFAESD